MKTTLLNKKPLIHNRKARRRGSTIVLIALSMISLLGFSALAVDYGLLVNDANRAQRSADAAALAGASQLCMSGGCENTTAATLLDQYNRIEYDKARARYMAEKAAFENNLAVTASEIQLTPDTPGVPARTVRVTPRVTRSLFFGRAIGANSASLARTARAGRLALRGLGGAVPLAITTNDYYAYNDSGASFELRLIRNQNTNFDPGTLTAVDLRPDNSGKAVDVFEEDLKFGYNGGIIYLNSQINSALNAEIAAQGQKLESAFDYRIVEAAKQPYGDSGSSHTYPNYPAGSPRIVTILVADPNPANNNNPQLNVRFFVSVYLEQIRSPGNLGVYVRMRILPTRTYNSFDSLVATGDESMAITGPSAVVLMN